MLKKFLSCLLSASIVCSSIMVFADNKAAEVVNETAAETYAEKFEKDYESVELMGEEDECLLTAIDEEIYDDGIGVLLDVDFTKLDELGIDDMDKVEKYLSDNGISLSGKYEMSAEPQKVASTSEYDITFDENTQVLKLIKDGGEILEDGTVVREANPGTMTVKWDNGHANGVYRIQMEVYQRGVDRQLMQSPVVFMDIKDTDYGLDGLDITRISYEDVTEKGMKKRVYANLLAGIEENSDDNYIDSNTNTRLINNWSTIEATVDTTDGECSAVSSNRPEQRQTRFFEDESVRGNFAPNQFTTIASTTTSDRQVDMYIRRIRVTGPTDYPTEYPVEALLSVDTSSLNIGAYTGTEDESVTVTENDDCSVSVVADDVKGKAIKIADSASSKQATVKFDLGEAVDGIIRYNASYKFDIADTSGDDAKDAILLRLQNPDLTPAITNRDGRFAEIKTAKSGTQYELKYSDYFTANGMRATDTSTGIKLDFNTWYDITVELNTNTNIVKILARGSNGKVVGTREIALPSSAVISLKNATIATKSMNTASTDIYISNPWFVRSPESITLPPVESEQPDTPDVWMSGVSDVVFSKNTAIPLNPNDDMWQGFNELTSTANRNGITFYMDQSRDIGSNGGTTTDGNSGKLAAQSMNASDILAPYNFGSGISFCTSAIETSLFEGLMVKTADGQNVYVSPDSKVGILINDPAKPEVGYLYDGTEVKIADLPEQNPTYTEPYQKVMGFKVSGTCQIRLISAGRDSRQFLFTDKDGNILNADKDGNPTGQAESAPITDVDGQQYFGASYNGGEGEIYVSCPQGAIPMFGLEIMFDDGGFVNPTVPVTGISLNKTSTTLDIGSTERLTATISPSDATNKNVTWSSSDTNVATVSQSGLVTGISAGTAEIVVRTTDGYYTDWCYVTVEESSVCSNVKVSSASAMIGDTVDITVDITENTGFANLGLEVGYDSNALTLVNAVNNSDIDATYTPAQSFSKNPYNMSWNSAENVQFNGTLVTLTFKVNENAQVGNYPITVKYYSGTDGNYTDGKDVNYDKNENPLNIAYFDGNIKVINYMPGDINGDGKINDKDAVFMLRYLAGWDISVVKDALDVNGDGAVNEKDGTELLRYLAGWDVELH